MAVFAMRLAKSKVLNKSLDKVRSALSNSDKAGVAMLNGRVVRAGKDDNYLYVLGYFEPAWLPVYSFAPYLLIGAIGAIVLWGLWWSLLAPVMVASTYFFYSGTWWYAMFFLWMRKAGYKGKMKRELNASVLRRYVDAWDNKK